MLYCSRFPQSDRPIAKRKNRHPLAPTNFIFVQVIFHTSSSLSYFVWLYQSNPVVCCQKFELQLFQWTQQVLRYVIVVSPMTTRLPCPFQRDFSFALFSFGLVKRSIVWIQCCLFIFFVLELISSWKGQNGMLLYRTSKRWSLTQTSTQALKSD